MGLLDQLLLPLCGDRPEARRPQQLVIEEGRVARRAGLPIDHLASNFQISDMHIDWQNGWRWEDEIIAERAKLKQG